MKSLAEILRDKRNSRDWSQEQLARAAGISLSSIRRLEDGHKSANLSTLAAVARALGLPFDEQTGRVGEAVRQNPQVDATAFAAELAVISDRLREIAEKMLSGREIEDFSDSATQRPTAAEQALKPAGERGR